MQKLSTIIQINYSSKNISSTASKTTKDYCRDFSPFLDSRLAKKDYCGKPYILKHNKLSNENGQGKSAGKEPKYMSSHNA